MLCHQAEQSALSDPGPFCNLCVDHGTYTPFALGPLAESGGYTLAVIEWVAAALGIAQLTGGIHYRHLSDLMAGMGWLGIFWIRPFIENASWHGFL